MGGCEELTDPSPGQVLTGVLSDLTVEWVSLGEVLVSDVVLIRPDLEWTLVANC